VDGFGRERQKVPEHVGVAKVGFGVTFLGVDEIREFLRVTDEENGRVVASHVPSAFFCVMLDGKATRIASSIGRAFFTTNGRESNKNRRAFANGVKEFGFAEPSDVFGDFKIAVRTSTLRVDDT
jgi:hypothetical protein